jgi:VanZ family protein
MRKIILIIIVIVCAFSAFSQNQTVPYTLADRDRQIRTEGKIESLHGKIESFRIEIDTKFESQQRQIDNLKELILMQNSFLYWAFGVIITVVLFTLGYTIWDRRTALQPVREKTYSVSEKVNVLESILKEEAKSNIRLAGIMRSYGIL